MALHQHSIAQPMHIASGHATRAGPIDSEKKEPFHYDFDEKGSFPQPPKFEDKIAEREFRKGRLAAAFRIFGERGFDEGVAWHITVRYPIDPETFWVNPFGVAFSHMRRSDLIRLGHDGKVLDGGANRMVNRAAVMIHVAIHQARPDVMCAAHTHSLYGRTFSTLGMPLPITSQDGCAFYDDLVHYNHFDGIVLEGDAGASIAQALGNKKAAILQNHGLITAAPTVEATVFWYIALEKLCYSQLMAMAALAGTGKKPVEVNEAEAKQTYLSIGPPMAGWFSAKPMFDTIARNTNEDYLA